MNDRQMPCPCTRIAQEEACPIGFPSLLCQICNGVGHVPAVKLDGSELWEIVYSIADDVAHDITDNQYQRIADAINHVFIDAPTPETSLGGVEDRISALLSNPTAVLVNWLRGDINLDLVVERLKREGALPPPANLEWLVKLMGTGGYNFEDELNDEDKAKLVAIRQTITDPSPAARKEFK
ncbi:hypothetical protein [Rhizobium tumorigenes]|uniref:hypothetical protein n=1 Tax=Rhizobium tumorigenes TaxID=2041385 RepID=UPI00241F262E|nr:hypothetical protein [Rhizobium tumorigenes]WFS01620.1 hypothetical protein PR016_03000 [Rhizobium tumorigenes]